MRGAPGQSLAERAGDALPAHHPSASIRSLSTTPHPGRAGRRLAPAPKAIAEQAMAGGCPAACLRVCYAGPVGRALCA